MSRTICTVAAWATGAWALAGGAVAEDATIEMAAVVARDGFGGGASDLVVAADGSGRLWATTDRGPNGTTKVGDKKLRTLLDPEFVPHLVELELPAVGPSVSSPAVTVVRRVALAGRTGTPLSGRPNGVGRDEPIVDAATGSPVVGDPNGVDTEGLVQMADGTFWMVEEYRPSLLHVSAEGRVLARFVPRGTRLDGADAEVHAVLPEAYAARRDNRGFESIAVSPDGSRLWTMLQSPLDNGSEKRIKKAGNVRLLAFDPVAGTPLAEHVYRVGDPTEPEYLTNGAAPDDAKICALAAIDADTLLVIESDDGGRAILYRIDLAGVTDTLARPADDGGRSLDEARDLPAAGIVPVAKTLVADLAPLVPAMRRDVYGEDGAKSDAPLKLEGMAILGPDRVALVNDNDFGVHVKPGDRCDTCLWVVRLPHPLRPDR
jgi:hypothetical protein